MKSLSGREMAHLLERRGWRLIRIRGGHHLYRKGSTRVVVPIHSNQMLKAGLTEVDSIQRGAEAATNLHGEEHGYQRYSMIIERSDKDDAYVVTVPELPGCMTHAATHAEAVGQGEDAAAWPATARTFGDPIPPPRVFAMGRD